MNLEKAVLSTLVYHDIFNYPLTAQQVHKFLIGKKADLKKVTASLKKLTDGKKIGEKDGYYFLKNRQGLVKIRKSRTKHSEAKLKRAFFYSTLLMLIPTVKLVAVSGALAMDNSHQNDDIDLVIVTSKGTLWTTRLLSTLILFPFKRKRGEDLRVNNKACLNLFLAENGLEITRQNLYTAHEIAQMKLLWDKDGSYEKFLTHNSWVKEFLPNWNPAKQQSKTGNHGNTSFLVSSVEHSLWKLQHIYMKRKISKEQIGDRQIFFHPRDTQSTVLKDYKLRSGKYLR